MLRTIASKDSLTAQAQLLKANGKFKPGFDNMTAASALLWVEINCARLTRDILKGRYAPMPAAGFRSAKKNGGYRRFVRLTALDRIVQGSILDAVRETVEARFSDASFAYRSDRGVAAALQRYCTLASEYAYAATLDPAACFDNIDHEVLSQALDTFGMPEDVTALMMKFVRMPVMEDDKIIAHEKGLLQGAPLSPLLCNIYFDSMDKHLEQLGIPFIRYADDIVLFSHTLSGIRENVRTAEKYMLEQLRLRKNEHKSKIDSSSAIRFLGHRFICDRCGMIALEANAPIETAYHKWHSSSPENNRRRVDILSDGILRQHDYSLLFESETADTDIPIASTDVINIYSSVTFDTGFLQKALDSGIIINVFSESGKLTGAFYPNAPLKSPRVTNEQLSAYCSPERRVELACKFVLASIHNLRLNIRYYNKQNPLPLYDSALRKINALAAQIKTCGNYEELLTLEAQVRQHYYACYDAFIGEEDFVFERRTRKPPENKVNSMLSFGNTVLYNLLATQIYKSPLDVRVGFLHATCNRAESLNLDLAEIFKPLVVDRTVFSLINHRIIRPEHFTVCENDGVYLTREGKKIFLQAFYDKLETVVSVKERKMNYHEIIADEIQRLVRHFRSGDKYVPFKQVR